MTTMRVAGLYWFTCWVRDPLSRDCSPGGLFRLHVTRFCGRQVIEASVGALWALRGLQCRSMKAPE